MVCGGGAHTAEIHNHYFIALTLLSMCTFISSNFVYILICLISSSVNCSSTYAHLIFVFGNMCE